MASYRIPGLPHGRYTVIVTRDGFQTKQIDAVELQVGETHTLDAVLSVGTVSERVEVIAEAEPYERSSAESAIVIQTDQIDNLPTNGRNWSTLTLLSPWAQDDGGGDQRTIRFAGRARDDNNFTFDGVDATGIQEEAQKSTTRLQVSEDAIAEYRVDSALYDAEYGSQAGGQVNVVTKSGTNQFHGTAFGYLRNSVFDAREFIDPPQIPAFRLGQFGGTVGGPIKKDKAFFFLSYEGLRQLQNATTSAAVPDPGLQAAILTKSPVLCGMLQARGRGDNPPSAQNEAPGLCGETRFSRCGHLSIRLHLILPIPTRPESTHLTARLTTRLFRRTRGWRVLTTSFRRTQPFMSERSATSLPSRQLRLQQRTRSAGCLQSSGELHYGAGTHVYSRPA